MVVPKTKITYEESRRQRMEENKKRMEQLNLNKLAFALKPSPKSSPAKPRLPRQPVSPSSVPIRRSSRVASLPSRSYKEVPLEPLNLQRPRRSYQRRDLLNRVYASDEVRQYAIERAEELLSGLGSEYPCFIKPMLQSHVTGGFWLGLPLHFCKNHLPQYDETIDLIDEDGQESPTKYLADRTGLSGGWRGFAIDHELVDGDALVFQLIKPTKFKVFIIRAYESEKEEKGDEDEDLDATQLNRSSKRIRAGRRQLRYLFRSWEPILKADSEVAVVIGMLNISIAIRDKAGNLILFFFQYCNTSKSLNNPNSSFASSKYSSN
ncbi:B3 domain-containing protein [Senna tora]|uniref:B3 domain-containing protein n=1 Tax=Senna tora TaxID=362788 RepID=A0A834SW36_9FABA|nr:B3 domain-containing protein [Senna tora]